MADDDLTADLHAYLRDSRQVLVWKLDGLDEYDIRRPMTPTGTNLLGLVKHSGATHVRYFADLFDRPTDPALPWLTVSEDPNTEMWATPGQSTADVIDACRQAWTHADTTISDTPLDARVRMPWWGDSEVTLHRVLVHVTAETQRHAGHADIIRELLDGTAGLLDGFDNLHLPDTDRQRHHLEKLEAAACLASGREHGAAGDVATPGQAP